MLLKLCEKMGRRLRKAGFIARSIHFSCLYADQTRWHKSQTFHTPLYTTQDLYTKVLLVFNYQPERKKITHLAVSCFKLIPTYAEQLELFCSNRSKKIKAAKAVDKINNRFGEFTMIPAKMLGMNNVIVDRIAFGGVRELEDIYE